MDDKLQVFAGRMVYRLAKGFFGGLQEALGIEQLNATAVAFLAGFGITLQVAGPLMPAIIVGLGGLAFSLLMAINGAYNLAKAAGGIYSTVTGAYKNFYEHELTESVLMEQGFSYENVHDMALKIHEVLPQALYSPEVIKEYYKWFNKLDYEY